ncbi:MAG: nucleotidyltransferase domain-containing protein [Sulfuriflexus sp.]|nr:nucleotidyltransferase domain-containing protein [Sulfuriflexus sp.]
MDIKKAAQLVSKWAKEKREIKSVHFFGSRVKGTHTGGSDLDIAIKLMPDLEESGGLSTWMRYSDQWAAELNSLVPYVVQAEWDDGENTNIINKGLSEARMFVYEKEI